MLPRPLLTPTLTLLAAATALLSFAAPASAEPACGTDNLLAGKQPQASQELKGDAKFVTDGIAAPEGSAWDAPITVTLGSGAGFISYDLGELRAVSAVVMQGDANDVYKVTGSADGSPGSFKMLVELPNVVGTGQHGLRTRAVKFDATKVRYLRIGEPMGDNFFSISELAAYCKAPTPFPPAVRVVDVPPPPAPESSATPKPGKDTGPSALLLTVIALSLVYLAYKMVLPRPPEPPTGSSSGKDDDDDDDDESDDGDGDKKADGDGDKKADTGKDAPGGSSSDKSST